MKLESQVVSLPLAKRLKELGVRQESIFEWVETPEGSFVDYRGDARTTVEPWYISAFTAVELMEISKIVPPVFNFREQRWKWFSPDYEVAILDENETDARAKALIYLIEQGIVKI